MTGGDTYHYTKYGDYVTKIHVKENKIENCMNLYANSFEFSSQNSSSIPTKLTEFGILVRIPTTIPLNKAADFA